MARLVLKNGLIVDGTTSPPRPGDLAIEGDRIAEMGTALAGETLLDCSGLAIAPGFIDTHSHSDLRVLAEPDLPMKVRQGITLEVLGQDGISVAPVRPDDQQSWKQTLSGLLGDFGVAWDWFAACAAVFAVVLAGTLLHPIYIYTLQPFPLVPLVAGYLGLFLLGLSFIACGIFVSSLTESQVVAGMATIGILLLFWILSWNEAATSPGLLRVLVRVSMFDHFQTFARGAIDVQDLAYFLSFIGFFSFLTLRVLEARQWRGRR